MQQTNTHTETANNLDTKPLPQTRNTTDTQELRMARPMCIAQGTRMHFSHECKSHTRNALSEPSRTNVKKCITCTFSSTSGSKLKYS